MSMEWTDEDDWKQPPWHRDPVVLIVCAFLVIIAGLYVGTL